MTRRPLQYERFDDYLSSSHSPLWTPGCGMAIRREAFEQIGGFTNECIGGEDSDLALRLGAWGGICNVELSPDAGLSPARAEHDEAFRALDRGDAIPNPIGAARAVSRRRATRAGAVAYHHPAHWRRWPRRAWHAGCGRKLGNYTAPASDGMSPCGIGNICSVSRLKPSFREHVQDPLHHDYAERG